MSVRPLVKDAVTTRMHMLTAIPMPRSRLRRNWRTRLRKAIFDTTRTLRTFESMEFRKFLISIFLA